MKSKKVVVTDSTGKAVGWFKSVSDASRSLKMAHVSILKLIRTSRYSNGLLLRFAFEGEDLKGLKSLSVPLPKAKRFFEKQSRQYKDDDKELDTRKYCIVPYEVVNKRVCITRCTVLEDSQPFVGSRLCMECKFNKGRNKKTHQVACSNIVRRHERNLNKRCNKGSL